MARTKNPEGGRSYLHQHTETLEWSYRRIVPAKPEWLRLMMGCKAGGVWRRPLGTTELSRIDTAWANAHVEYERAEKSARNLMGTTASPHDGEREQRIRFIAELRSRAGGQLPARHADDPVETEALMSEYGRWCVGQGLPDPYEGIPADHYHRDGADLIAVYELMRVETKLRLETLADVPAPITIKPATGRADSLVDLEIKYLDERPNLSRAIKGTLKAMISLFVKVNGNIAAQRINSDHAIAFREAVARLNDAPNTKNRKIRTLAALLSWAKEARYVETNPLAGISFDTSSVRSRDPFGADDLRKLFKVPALISPTGRYGAAPYWVTMLALLEGMRLREAAQLDRTDLMELAGMWVIRIDQTVPGQSVKTKSSRRLIPVHRDLIRLGFVNMVNRIKSGPLFPQLNPGAGEYSGLSVSLNKIIRDGGITNEQIVFHSTRHTMITFSRESGMDTEIRKAITGHSAEDIGSQYGVTSLKAKARELNKLRYPVKFPKLAAMANAE